MTSPIRLQRTDIGMSLTQLISTEPPSGYTWHFGAQEAGVGNAVLPLPAWETSLKRSDPSRPRFLHWYTRRRTLTAAPGQEEGQGGGGR